MKNKWMLFLLTGVLVLPVFAAEEAADVVAQKEPTVVAEQGGPRMKAMRPGDFKKAQKEHRAKMKATEEKMEKLVKEYKKLKGKKQEAKKAEIVAEVEKIREEQLKFKQAQLDKFAKRLEEMKKHLEEEKSPEGQKVWVDKKTNALIESDGSLKVLFDRPAPQQFQDGKVKKYKGFRFHGPKGGQGPHMRAEQDPGRVGLLPPPPAEEK
ncbi:MAG: hypothetical protein MJ053_05245 [Elusimicrobiaceae bacterium]|nr:hypothetical protein [Elusimicrobiaceae bacterium]